VALLALLCVIIAAVVVAVAIASGTSSTAVQVRKTVASSFQDAYNQVQKLINDYTK
jgi:outer membrane murein-binding lipoprotein Lpp